MRRLALLAVFATSLLLASLFAPFRSARTQTPGAPRPVVKLDIRDYDLGALAEGDGPPLERFHPSAPPSAPLESPLDDIPVPEGMTVDFAHYPSPGEIATFLTEIEAAYPDLVEVQRIGTSAGGRAVHAVRVANESLPGAPSSRPAVYIDGQHHAREFISNQVTLYTLWWLVHFHGRDPLVTHLVDTRTIYFVPSVNPDGNHIAYTDNQVLRGSANPRACDDDGDGAYDEDTSLGYGYGTHELFLYHFDQAWADAHPDNPFVGDWYGHMVAPTDGLGRFTGALGGPRRPIPRHDRDGDGAQNEDEVGAVDTNRNYDSHWDRGDAACMRETYRGPEPFSEAETRIVRDFLAGIDHLSVALSNHSGVDRILHPWGWSRSDDLPDAETFELLARKGSQLTEANGFAGSPHTWTARGLYPGSGSAMDYLYEHHGAYAFTPEVYGGSYTTFVERLGATGTYTIGQSTAASFNPAPDEIVATTERWNRWALYLVAATPNIELISLAINDGALVATLGNDGVLPVEVTGTLLDAHDQVLETFGPTELALTATKWSVPVEPLVGQQVRLMLAGVQPIGTVPHQIENAAWTFDVTPTGVSMVEGRITPWVDLGAFFEGGWWADEQWDEPGRYHLPPNRPIDATAPATPTEGASPSPPPSPTETPAPTDTPTPTATASPSPTTIPSATPTPTAPTTVPATPEPSPAATTATPPTPDRPGRALLPSLHRGR